MMVQELALQRETLAQAGQGKIAPEEIKGILRRKDRSAAGMTAPAHGLVL